MSEKIASTDEYFPITSPSSELAKRAIGDLIVLPENVIIEDSIEVEKQVESLGYNETANAINRIGQVINKIILPNLKAEVSPNERDASFKAKLDDLDGDRVAVMRLESMFRGWAISRGNDHDNMEAGLSFDERLEDLINIYGGYRKDLLTPEQIDNLFSNGGLVFSDPETGALHYGSHNNSLYYSFVRAKQILDTVNADPDKVRQTILEASNSETPDINWIISQPVIDPMFKKK